MAIAKIIEIKASSDKSMEDAVKNGLKKVAETVKNVKGAYIKETTVTTDDQGNVTEWRVDLMVTFLVN